MDKYPKSKLQPYITTAFATMLYTYQQTQDYKRLGPLAEQWLKYQPDDLATVAYIAESAQKTGDHRKFIEFGQRVYAAKPSGNLAFFLAESYKKVGDKEKYLEWTEKCFPYFPENFGLRMEFVTKYTDEKNFEKAAQYAQLALNSLEVSKKPESTSEIDWRKAVTETKRGCLYLIGVNHYDKEKYRDAISSFEDSLKVDKFAGAYYYIGLSQWKLDQVEEAILSFAKAYLLKGEVAEQSKEYLEKLYKAIHNNTLIGVEKVYAKAQKELGVDRSAANE